ncbi:MAG: glutamate formimidoyltransferase [Bacteroidia bacterium]|nr:glutamate formimidoyltransferase [Bacteroidia bacterium]
MSQILECVPNFSEGRNPAVIKQITDAISAVSGVKLLDVDPGKSTNRTVVTIVGSPDAVIEAAFQGIKKAAEVIDMSKHEGTHPRMGATDVCPLIPIAGISEEEAVKYAHKLAKRVGEELSIPVYLYEKAAQDPKRQNLATIRAGEYEGFEQKILLPEWKPDYGPARFHAKAGQTVIGVRDFLVAYNINLNTQSIRRANSVAFDIREKGRIKTEDGKPTGKPMKDAEGKPVREPGTCPSVKAIGWYVEEYGIAQVSANLTNINITPVHVAFEAARDSANARGMRVTGSELVGLIPKQALLDAGYYYLAKQGLSQGVSEETLVQIAIKSLGLDELGPFDPQKKVIEYQLEAGSDKKLVQMNLREFANLTASDAPAPGGGSVSALVGAVGVALGTMVTNLSANKRGWEDRLDEFNPWGKKGQALKDQLLLLVDEDTAAFDKVMESFRLPRKTEEEKAARKEAIQTATLYAAEVPLRIAKTAGEAYPLLQAMADIGNPNSITDAGVGALCVHAAIQGAILNVRINIESLDLETKKQELYAICDRLVADSDIMHREVLAQVERVMKKG